MVTLATPAVVLIVVITFLVGVMIAIGVIFINNK
jgi:capsular polysaccharide biosynthesis protein